MNKQELQDRINKLNDKITKTTKLKDKYYNMLDDNIKNNLDVYVNMKWSERDKILGYDKSNLVSAYKAKEQDLVNFNNTLAKYQNQLKGLDELVDIPVLKKFIDNWKKSAYEWYNIQIETFLKDPKRYDNLYINKNYNQLIWELATYYSGEGRKERLQKIIDNEAQAKYKTLVERISNICGEIEDCSSLRIGMNSEINGIIKGSKGNAKIETIGAGGYNVQCYHYRVLVREI